MKLGTSNIMVDGRTATEFVSSFGGLLEDYL